VQNFRQLQGWQKAHTLTLAIYHATALFPTEERYGLTSQIRRASSSIPANIAEGCGRGTQAEVAQFLQIARGSASELDYHLQLAHDLNLLSVRDHEYLSQLVEEVQRMPVSFRRTVRAHSS
jgi:four helix bundle protein